MCTLKYCSYTALVTLYVPMVSISSTITWGKPTVSLQPSSIIIAANYKPVLKAFEESELAGQRKLPAAPGMTTKKLPCISAYIEVEHLVSHNYRFHTREGGMEGGREGGKEGRKTFMWYDYKVLVTASLLIKHFEIERDVSTYNSPECQSFQIWPV